MKIVIVGSGNVATVLARKCKEAGHDLLQVMSQHETHAAILAAELNCAYTSAWEKITRDADIYILAITDSSLSHLPAKPFFGNKIIVHTAGSVSREVLQRSSLNYGVLYPLQRLRREIRDIPEMPLLVDGNTPDVLAVINDFAGTLSTNVSFAGDETRMKLHLAAVLVSNFTNYLYTLSADFCKQEHINWQLLLPLIGETAYRLRDFAPQQLQTGPAVRHDQLTIEKQLQQLESYPETKRLYKSLTESIQAYRPVTP